MEVAFHCVVLHLHVGYGPITVGDAPLVHSRVKVVTGKGIALEDEGLDGPVEEDAATGPRQRRVLVVASDGATAHRKVKLAVGDREHAATSCHVAVELGVGDRGSSSCRLRTLEEGDAQEASVVRSLVLGDVALRDRECELVGSLDASCHQTVVVLEGTL